MMENDDTLIKNFMLANKHEIVTRGYPPPPPTSPMVIGYTQCNLRHCLLCIILYFQWL